jgi:multicomponent Na+:H+ antiporter subunit D
MPLLFIALPLLAVVVLNICYRIAQNGRALWVAMSVCLAQIGLSGYYAIACLHGQVFLDKLITPLSVNLLSALVLMIIGLVAFVTLVVAQEMKNGEAFNFGTILLLLVIGMNGITMVTDLFSMYVFIEITSAASFILIAIHKHGDELEGAFKYYLMSAVATVLLLMSIAFFFMLVGDTSLSSIAFYIAGLRGQYPLLLTVAMGLAIVALAIKSGIVPFHTWVPDAHSSAPSPVSVILSGAVIKVTGVYALLKVYREAFLTDAALGRILLILGLLSVIVGALGAIGQNDIKRLLAYSSVSQVGFILLGIASGKLIGFYGAIFHFFNHATFKSLLFVDAAAIVKQTGTRNMDELGGLGSRMPFTSTSSILAFLSMSGIPPLSGFWSKMMIILSVFEVSRFAGSLALLASILTIGYFLLVQRKVFFGKPEAKMRDVEECGAGIVGVEVLLSSINVAVGVFFPLILLLLRGQGLI